ncbi:MAG TPA: hypothetical protein VF273_05060, partial [Pelobium sp.]
FKKAYPNVKAKWEKEGLNYEAGFTKDGHETSVIYNPDGLATATEVEIAISALPKPVKDKLAQNYKGAKIKEAAKITKGNGAVEYEAEINGKDILFSAEGKALNNGKTAD